MQTFKKYLAFIIGFLICFSVYSQNSTKVLDTIYYKNSKLVLFNNNTWEFIESENDLNIGDESFYHQFYDENWNTSSVHAYSGFDYETIKDTVTIELVNDSLHFSIPSYGNVISRFGWRGSRIHTGVDFKHENGDSIFAAFTGIVRFAGWNSGGYGNVVIIRHYNGLETYYSHLSKIKVSVNDFVNNGDLIGLAGKTGKANGVHLHFEVRYKDNPFDPEYIIDIDNQKLKSDEFTLMPEKYEHIKEVSKSKYHIVSKGDTLWNISRRYGLSVDYLCNLNGITRSQTLNLGQRLKLR
jgi:murein DD-endopeptidase MepM/ murein hydrolase activator NlpD